MVVMLPDMEIVLRRPNVRDALRTLVEQGVFEIRNGNATLHFDTNGILVTLDIQVTWRRKVITRQQTV